MVPAGGAEYRRRSSRVCRERYARDADRAGGSRAGAQPSGNDQLHSLYPYQQFQCGVYPVQRDLGRRSDRRLRRVGRHGRDHGAGEPRVHAKRPAHRGGSVRYTAAVHPDLGRDRLRYGRPAAPVSHHDQADKRRQHHHRALHQARDRHFGRDRCAAVQRGSACHRHLYPAQPLQVRHDGSGAL